MKICIHTLTPYPPSLPNRGELQEAKTAIVGGTQRQRISSQALKRAWRLSKPMAELEATMSVRTRRLGAEVANILVPALGDKDGAKAAIAIGSVFGKIKKDLQTEEVVVLGREEWDAAHVLAALCAAEKRQPTEDETKVLPRETVSVDVGMFGRMRAAQPDLNVDAAIAVSHALTTGKVAVEADFWTAVDDLNEAAEDSGSGGMGEREFGSGCYYTFVLVDFESLVRNLGDEQELASKAVLALLEAITTTTPGGHRSSYAHHTRSAYLRVELGDEVSGNLMMPAFEEPIVKTADAIASLRATASAYASAYGLTPKIYEMSVPDAEGSLQLAKDQMRMILAAPQ